jgi:hypothetical protein
MWYIAACVKTLGGTNVHYGQTMGICLGLALASLLAAAQAPEQPAPPLTRLWDIGVADNSAAEFALGPGKYREYSRDGFFVVGWSDAKNDWPYVHPGPADGWAGDTPRIFTILFTLSEAPEEGECQLQIDLLDAHATHPPKLVVTVNGQRFSRLVARGSGTDAAIAGDAAKGQEQQFATKFPARLLRPADNVITIANEGGSWLLYDSLALDTPPGAVLERREDPITQIVDVQSPPLLIEKDGVLFQTLRIPVNHFGQPLEGVFRFAAQEPVPATLQAGPQELEMQIPAVEQPLAGTLEFVVGEEVRARRDFILMPARKWTIYLMHHTHLDIGYTHVQTEVEQIQWRHMDQALELAAQTAGYPPEARFKWLPEGLWAVDSYLKQATPEKRQAFIDAVKAGSIGLDALYGNQLTALCRPEELIELTGYARRLGRDHGLTIDTAMISDVPGYTWGLIPVLAQSGVKYFSIGPNAGHRIGYTLSTWGDKPFYWVSPSGEEKVLCWVAAKAYSWFHSRPMGDGARLLEYLEELQAAKFPYDIVQVRYNIGGDNGPPDPKLPEFVKDWNAKYAYPKLVLATSHEAFAEFEQRYGESLPRVTGDFTPYWEDGAASSARETGVNRDAAERLVQAQALWALLNPAPYPAAEFEAAWRNVILYDEHTWGAHNSISEPESDFAKGQWAIKQAFAIDADRQTRALLDQSLAAVKAAPGNAAAVLVYNTNSWPRTSLVTLPKEWNRPGDQVNGANGKAVPSQALSTGELAFLAKDVPPFGAVRYTLSAGAAGAKGDAVAGAEQLSNGLLTVTIDPATGAISSLKHRDRAADLVDLEKGPGLNDYLYVAGRNPKEPQRNGAPTIAVKEPGPLVASLLIQSDAPGCRSLSREIRVTAGLDHVEIIDTLDKENIYEKEAVHLAFPFKVPGGVVRMDIPFAVARPEADQLEGSCKNYFTVQRWVDVSNEEYGVTWATIDAPLVEVGALTNDPTVVGWIKTLEPSTTLYSYVMNNYWETNYKASQDGPTLFRYALRPHAGYDAAAAQQFGIACSQPLVAVPAGETAQAAPARVRIMPEGVVATVLKPSDDGQAQILRLFNATGQAQNVKLEWAQPKPERVEISTLAEEPGTEITGAMDMVPWQLVTLRVTFP